METGRGGDIHKILKKTSKRPQKDLKKASKSLQKDFGPIVQDSRATLSWMETEHG